MVQLGIRVAIFGTLDLVDGVDIEDLAPEPQVELDLPRGGRAIKGPLPVGGAVGIRKTARENVVFGVAIAVEDIEMYSSAPGYRSRRITKNLLNAATEVDVLNPTIVVERYNYFVRIRFPPSNIETEVTTGPVATRNGD